MDDPFVWEALVIHDPSMVQARDHKPAAKGKNKSRGRCKALKSMFKCVTSHLGLARGGRAGREEPLPPTASGTHRRTVSSIDGSIEYVKVGSQVSNPALSKTHSLVERSPGST